MALVDFTTWNKVDPESTMTVQANSLYLYLNNDINENAYVVGDYGAGHFGNFIHYLKSIWSYNYGQWNCQYALGNTSTPTYASLDSANVGIAIIGTDQGGGGNRLGFINFENNSGDWYGWYSAVYLTLERTSSTVTLKVYSDSDRTDLLDTLSVTHTSTTFRYASVSGSGGASAGGSGEICRISTYDLDLNESADITVTVSALTLSLSEPSNVLEFAKIVDALNLTLASPSPTLNYTQLISALTLSLSQVLPNFYFDVNAAVTALSLTLSEITPSLYFDLKVFASALSLTLSMPGVIASFDINVLVAALNLTLAIANPTIAYTIGRTGFKYDSTNHWITFTVEGVEVLRIKRDGSISTHKDVNANDF